MTTRGSLPVLVLAALVGWIGTAGAQQAKCLAAKTKCVSAFATAALKCHAAAETPGKPADPNAKGCLDKAEAKFDGGVDAAKGCFAKLEAKATNDCQTTDDTQAALAAITACVDQAVTAIDPGEIDQNKCGAGKKKCVGARIAGRLKCVQLAQTPGKAPDPNAKGCLDKVELKYTGSSPENGCFAKLEAKPQNGCIEPIGNAGTVATIVDACVDAVVGSLTPPSSTTSTSSTSTTSSSTSSTSTSVTTTTSSSAPTTTSSSSTSTTSTSAPTTTSSSTSTTSTSTPTTTTTSTTINPLCGNGVTNPGESCDDGNNSDNDLCPADCTIASCTYNTTDRDVSVRFQPPAGANIAGITVLLDYPEGIVHINQTSTTIPAGTILNTIGGAITTNADLNHALRGSVARATPLPVGRLYTVRFDSCTGAPDPTPQDFPCTVLAASDQFSNPVSGVTCFVTIP